MFSRKFSFSACLLLFLFAAALPAAAQLPPAKTTLGPKPPQGMGGCAVDKPTCAEVAPAIIKSALGKSPLEENLRYLTDAIGGRVTGSPAADRAVGWAVEAFRKSGVDEVHTEKFTVPVGWSEGRTRLEILAPEPFSVRLVAFGWSPPTPAAGITADIVDVGKGDEAGFAIAGASAKGAILLVHTELLETLDQLFGEYMGAPPIIDRAVKSGAAALFWMSSRPSLLLYRHSSTMTGELDRLPMAVLAREDAGRIARFLAAGEKVHVHFNMPNEVTRPITSENVAAEIRGREKPDEFVILGAHLDSWELGTGALDNGCNAAMVIDAARAIHAAGIVPRRSIRFILFTGEEEGMVGSAAYARAHRSELDKMDAAVIFDEGTGHVTGFSLGARKDIVAAVNNALQPIVALGAGTHTTDAIFGTDNLDFMLEGVPTLVANQEPANYLINYHAASDTFDKVDMAELKRQVAISAVAAYGIADRTERLGPRQSRAEIEALIKESGFDQQMRGFGFWPLWESGARGRAPQ
jgi:carboxypeptidase Q